MQLLHPSVLLDFGATNHGRPHIACSRILGGGHPGGLLITLGERRLQSQCGGMAEAGPRRPMCLPGLSMTGMTGCRPSAWLHVLKVLGQVGFNINKLHHFELVGVGANHRWLHDGVNISLRDLMHFF